MKQLLWGTLLLLASSVSASAATLFPSTATPTLGSTFTIDLVLQGNTDEVIGFGLDYTISTPSIVLQSYQINPFLTEIDLSQTTKIAGIGFPGDTSTNVTLVRFTFLANQLGSSVFSITSDLNDPNEGAFFLSQTPADLDSQVTISVLGTSIPEPGSIGLGAMGLILIVAARRKRRV